MTHTAANPATSSPRPARKTVRGGAALKFLLRRLLHTAIVLFGVLVLVFLLIHLVPGDPVRIALGTRYTQEAYDALRAASGLDQPLIQQFFTYVGHAVTGDLGVSFRNGQPVTQLLLERLPATISLALVGLLIALLISIPAGTYAALKEGRFSDGVVRVFSQFGVSIPDFWMGMLLITLFSGLLGWLPSSGYVAFSEDPQGWLRHVITPAITIGLVAGAIMTRYVRGAVIEITGMSYVRTAKSKGLRERTVVGVHIARNAFIPVLTIIGIQMATMLGGVLVVEVVFAWPGLGRMVFDSVAARDYPVVQGAVLLIALIFLIVNFIVDLLYALIDPRIRLS